MTWPVVEPEKMKRIECGVEFDGHQCNDRMGHGGPHTVRHGTHLLFGECFRLFCERMEDNDG